jgi:tetratricopeptide (TPR) repeat protein
VDTEERPLAGVEITALAEGGERPTVATTNKKGVFVLGVPDSEDTYVLTAALDGYVTATAKVRQDPEDPVAVNFTLPKKSPPASGADTLDTPAEDAETVVGVTDARRAAAIPVFNQGVTALEADDYPTALAAFQSAAELDPTFPDAYRAIAAAALEMEDYATAADAAEKVLEFDPDNVGAMGSAYYAELLMGDGERMVVSARRLADADPGIVSNQFVQHSVALFEDAQYALSKALLEIIVEREPDLSSAQFQLGLTCNMLGDTACAKAALARFLELDPDNPDADTARSLLQYLD